MAVNNPTESGSVVDPLLGGETEDQGISDLSSRDLNRDPGDARDPFLDLQEKVITIPAMSAGLNHQVSQPIASEGALQKKNGDSDPELVIAASVLGAASFGLREIVQDPKQRELYAREISSVLRRVPALEEREQGVAYAIAMIRTGVVRKAKELGVALTKLFLRRTE